MTDRDLAFTPAYELRELIEAKKVSPVELTENYLRRIDELDSKLNAYLTLDRDGAMAAAREAEAAVARGDELGPLHGLPISIKDLELSKGIRTTSGSLVFEDRVPDEDSTVVERVRDAGAIVLGKTNTSEFGMLGAGENRLGDHCRNPWNTERTTGASSAGAGASEAAGLCALATGSDGGGSIRIPASYCGLYGIKPTQGRVPKYAGAGAPILPNLYGQSGPMTRNVRDSAMLLQVLSGHDARDPSSLRDPVPDFAAALDRSVDGLRIGWSPRFGYAAVDPEVADTTAAAAKVFEELGCSVDESDLVFDDPFSTWWAIATSSSHVTNGYLLEQHAEQLTWYMREALEDGKRMTLEDYMRALGHRDVMRWQMQEQFDRFDLLMSPTMPTTAFPCDQYPEEIDGIKTEPSPHWGFLPFTHPINMVGAPAATVPCGFSADGMPIGLHIIGREGDEETVLAASAAFERARPWADRRPPVS